jgi:hypothetical protein
VVIPDGVGGAGWVLVEVRELELRAGLDFADDDFAAVVLLADDGVRDGVGLCEVLVGVGDAGGT